MNPIYALANQKGGVGKTTSCINIAAALAARGQKVLLLDMDPQGNATMGSGLDKQSIVSSMTELLLGEANVFEVIQKNTPAGYDLIASNSDLTAAEVSLIKKEKRETILKEALKPICGQYDVMLMDCPPALNMLTLNALVCARAVIIPMQCEYFALEGLSDLLHTVSEIKKTLNPAIEIMGIIRTMFDPRNRLAVEVSDQLIQHFGNQVFQTIIPRNIRLAEAPSHGLPIAMYDKASRGAASYMTLAAEVLKRHQAFLGSVTEKSEAQLCPISVED